MGTRVTRRRAALVGLVACAAVLTACSTVSTAASEVSLEYGGGSFDSANFVKCFGPGYKSTTEGASDDYKYYPIGQRDFSFGDGKGMDMAPLSSFTKDTQQIQVTGTIKFTMNLSCKPFKDPSGKKWPGGTAQFFHELIGSKDYDGHNVFNTEGSRPYGDGWRLMLRQYVGFAVDREVDDNALDYTQQQLTGERQAKDTWERDVLTGLPETLRKMTNGVEIFTVKSVLLQRPGVAGKIADANADKEAARIRAEAVDIDKQAAANFPGGIEAYAAYQQQQAVNQAIKDGKIAVMPIPAGSPVIVQAPTGGR